jgi:2-oxoglutarate/2-oxoacid ferredoxin oxidoreductase subunit alpha
MSYLAGARLPCVVANVQRCGPGLGNVWTGQCDYLQAVKGGGNGDYHLIVLAPASPQEMMDLTILAFELSDKYRVPALILSDAIIGQMMEKVVIRDDAVKTFDKPWALTGAKNREKNVIRSLFGSEDVIEKNNNLLQETYSQIKNNEVRFESAHTDGAEIVVVAYGTSARIARTAVSKLREEGRRVGFFRPVSLYPFPYAEIRKMAAQGVKNFMSVEMSAGQMVEDLSLAAGGKAEVSFYGRTGGNIVEESEIIKRVLDTLNGKGGQYIWQL